MRIKLLFICALVSMHTYAQNDLIVNLFDNLPLDEDTDAVDAARDKLLKQWQEDLDGFQYFTYHYLAEQYNVSVDNVIEIDELRRRINKLQAANPVPDTVMGISNIGFNCEGLPDNSNALTIQWHQDLDGSTVMRLTGSGIKFYHYAVNTMGSGMDSLQIVRTFDTLLVDENGTGSEEARVSLLNQWRQDKTKTSSDLVTFANHALATDSKVIWVVNCFNGTVAETMAQLTYLFSRGVNVVGAELGNETYAWYTDHWDWYKAAFEPHLFAIRNKYPSLKISLVSGKMDRSGHRDWNNKLALYGNKDAVTVHKYLTATACPEMNNITEYVITDQPNVALNDLFISVGNCMLQSHVILNEVNLAKAKYNVPVWVTECNSKPYEKAVNSIVNGAWMLQQLYEVGRACEYFTYHNGISSALGGGINRANKFDLNPTGQTHFRRTAYWSLFLASKYPTAVEYRNQTEPGTYYFFNISPNSIAVANARVEAVKGKYAWSSAGYTGYMAKSTPPNMEVTGITVYADLIPSYSYGIIIIGCELKRFYVDSDGDGYGNSFAYSQMCSNPGGFSLTPGDCDDTKPGINPGATEVCNEFDDNCNFQVDEDLMIPVYFPDEDNDGYGAANGGLALCTQPAGYVSDNTDCNDANATIHPGATEFCGSVDSNCDNVTVACPEPDMCWKKGFAWWLFHKCKQIPNKDPKKCDCPDVYIPK